MRQVDQRVSVRCNLEALDREAVSSYISHRLTIAGGTRDRVSFGPSAVDLIAQKSGGVPRLINLICDRALHRGHLARTPLIDADIARVAIMDLGLADAAAPVIPTEIQEAPPVPAPPVSSSGFGSKKLFEDSDPRGAEKHEQIVFEEHDLLHADHAINLDGSAAPATESGQEDVAPPAPAAPMPDNGDRPLLFESRGTTWTGGQTSESGRRRWRRRTKRLMVAVVAMTALAGASYWQAQWDDSVEIMTAPEPPASPLPEFALTFQPRRPAERVPLTPATAPDAPNGPNTPNAASAMPDGIFAIDVALFNSRTRASRLVAELTAGNYRAYLKDLDLGDRGHLFEVMVGPFATRAAADAELARIQALPGYEDARVVSAAAPAP